MRRRLFRFGTLSLWVVAAAVALSACSGSAPVADDRSNVLLLVADDLGYADLGVCAAEGPELGG